MKKTTSSRMPQADASPPRLSPAEWKYETFQALWTTYLHLRAWGQPEYEDLTPEDKEYFKALVAKGRDSLFAHIEDCKRAVLRGGLGDQVHDQWLAIIGLDDFDLVTGFPRAKRDLLGKLLDEMYPLLVRLDPDALPSAGPASLPGGGAIPDDLVTTEVAIAEYYTSRATIRRKVKAGELHDYRPPNSPENVKFLLSRAELRRLFARKS